MIWSMSRSCPRRVLHSFPTRRSSDLSDTCRWVHDNVTLICEIVPPDRGPAPIEPIVPLGPPTLENHDKARSEEHTSELQSHVNLVCRLLLEKKNRKGHTSARDSVYRP